MKEIVNAKKAPAAVGPYVHAVKAGNTVYTSGQLGLEPQTGEFPEGVKAQTIQSLTNLGEVLKAAGCTFDDVVKTTVYLADMNDFGTVNEVYAEYFVGNSPARSCVEVAKLPKGGVVEIEAIAVK